MALSNPANRRIARHLANCRQRMGEQQRSRANPSGSGRCLASRVAAANNDNIVMVAHSLLCAIEATPLAMARPRLFRWVGSNVMMRSAVPFKALSNPMGGFPWLMALSIHAPLE
jgi:hypothetical protein